MLNEIAGLEYAIVPVILEDGDSVVSCILFVTDLGCESFVGIERSLMDNRNAARTEILENSADIVALRA